MQKKILSTISFFVVLTITFSSCATKKKVTAVTNVPTQQTLDVVDQNIFSYYFYEGIRLKENGQYDEAIDALLLCLDIDSLDAGVHSELSVLYAIASMGGETLYHIKKATELQPDNWWYNLRLISFYMDNKKWNEAIAQTHSLQKYYPQRIEVYEILPVLYIQNNEPEKAIQAYDQLENFTGISEELARAKFGLYISINKEKKAFAEIDRLINKYPTESRHKVFLGSAYMHVGKKEQALAIFQDVLETDSQSPYVYLSLADYYGSENNTEKATEAIKKALVNQYLDIDTKIEILGQYIESIVRDTTKIDEAEPLLQLLVDRYPLEEQVHGYYALFLRFRNRTDEAISEFETMLNINPKNEYTWGELIQIYYAQEDFEQIVSLTNRAIENIPLSPQWYMYQGIAYFQMEQYLQAVSAYKKGVELVPANQLKIISDFYSQIGDSYFKLNEKDHAFSYYEKALEKDPTNIYVMNNYAYYLSEEKKDLKKAERMSAKTIEAEPNNSTFLDTYAWIFYQQGNFSLAKFYIERAISSMKERPSGVIMEHYGDILWMLKEDEKAREMWEKAREIGGYSDELLEKIEKNGWERN